MGQQANVTSIEAIKAFRPALIGFDEAVDDAVTTLGLEVRRAVEWLEHDRAVYWPKELRRREEKLSQAKSNLHICLASRIGDHEPACFDQKKDLRKAEELVQIARRKVEAVKQWCRIIQHEVEEFEGKICQLPSYMETDFKRTVAVLDKIIHELEQYANLTGEGGTTSESRSSLTSTTTTPINSAANENSAVTDEDEE